MSDDPAARSTPPGTPIQMCAASTDAADDLRSAIAATRFLTPSDPRFMHGRAYSGPTTRPRTLWRSSDKPRDDHDAPSWLTASEFEDVPEVLAHKVRQLAALLRASKRTVLYTGAGISASVIGQAARSGTNTVGWEKNKMAAPPTPTHHALVRLHSLGLIHGWVQQNHDGLPQKAGFPQELINEVHGAWYDCSNPVVKYSGSLKTAEYEWLEREIAAADLVIALGTSLGGLNADRLATETAGRSGALGTAMINLQQTEHDGSMSLRVFGRTDVVLRLLLKEQGDKAPLPTRPPVPSSVSRVLVPYNASGDRLPAGGEGKRMWLDLRDGAAVKLHRTHNCQGAGQPCYIHIGAKPGQTLPYRPLAPGRGVGRVAKRCDAEHSFRLAIDGASMRLGVWWLDAAARGALPTLPLVNVSPEFEEVLQVKG